MKFIHFVNTSSEIIINNYLYELQSYIFQIYQSFLFSPSFCFFVALDYSHCVKSVQIRSYLWSVIFRIWTEYGKIWTRKNSVFGHFLRSEVCYGQIMVRFHFDLRHSLEGGTYHSSYDRWLGASLIKRRHLFETLAYQRRCNIHFVLMQK